MSLLEIALSDFSRIATIDFRTTSVMDSTFIHQFLNRDAPRLTSLRVHCDLNITRTQNRTLRDGLDLSSLQVLDLDGLPFHMVQKFFRPTLTQLKLSWPDHVQRSLAMDLLEPLSHMPLLESLEILTGYYYRSPDGASSTDITTHHDSPIQLPRLRYFELTSGYRHCGTILSSISFPTGTGITFHISLSEEKRTINDPRPFDDPTDTDTLLPVFRKTLRDLAARGSPSTQIRPLLSAFLQFRDRRDFKISRILAWDHTQDGEDAPGYVLPIARATVTIDMDDLHDSTSFRALRRFYTTLPLSSLAFLVIRDAQRACPSAYWTRLVEAAPALEHLDVTGSAHVLICCLNAIIGEIGEGSDDEDMVQAHIPLPLPRLTQLVIGPEGRKPQTGAIRDDFIEVLASTLRMRSQRAHPIRRLKLLWGPPRIRIDLRKISGKVDYFSELDYIITDSSSESSAEDSESDEDDGT
ncbi:hypothetical protein NLI96_g1024 [Meripilus lineatus]|uniref:F-box domain-containing protein n=1 Tax=Meripilus lineatus TaxID=2056292 RepID=A0AAD5YIT5_9APHY|nr:hypothetical protein NLI96_g1024 [Physisporinus lineatus]